MFLSNQSQKSKVESRKLRLAFRSLTFNSRLSGWLVPPAALIAALHSSTAFAQGCAMCYNTAAAAKATAIRALRSGILVLLIPPCLMFIGIFLAAFRNRERFNESEQGPTTEPRADLRTALPFQGPSETGEGAAADHRARVRSYFRAEARKVRAK
jgi:hypothetical protein